jgi:hypothetical protein
MMTGGEREIGIEIDRGTETETKTGTGRGGGGAAGQHKLVSNTLLFFLG